MKVILICIICKKIDIGEGAWSTLNGAAPKDAVNALCPNCSHERFPQFYIDYEKPERRFRKRISRLFRSESIKFDQ
jgi:hypothetical protein